MLKKTLKDLNGKKMISKGNILHTEVELDSAKLGGTQKVKFDIDFLGCVECSTPFPVFRIQIEDTITKFFQLISNAMQG
jgi:hypothetical protein